MFMSQKFQPVVTERKNLREVLSKRGRVPRYQYFHLQAFKLSIHQVADQAFVSEFWVFLQGNFSFFFSCGLVVHIYINLQGMLVTSFLVGRKALDLSDAISMTWCIMFYAQGKVLVAFCMILETSLFFLHNCCLWSLQALENYIWVDEWTRRFSLFLRASCALVWKNGAELKIRGTVTQSMEPNLGQKFLTLDLHHGP